MCKIVSESTGMYDRRLSPFQTYKVTEEEFGGSLFALQTRAKSGHMLVCKHSDTKWELTPELKSGEMLEVPVGAELKLVSPEEWKEMNGTNPSPM